MTVPTRATVHVPIEELIRLLALSPKALQERALRDLRFYLAISPLRVLTGQVSMGVVGSLFRAYREAKRRARRGAGHLIVLAFSGDQGDDFCRRIQYCRNRSKFAELLENAGNPEFVAIAAKYSETIEWIQGVLAEIAETVGDTVIPISFLLLALKDGLDELCHCCEGCGGRGHDAVGPCSACGGSGAGPRKS